MTYRDRPRPLAIAHRGGSGLAPENTLAAFRRSYDLGVRYLETDVRLTSDGHLVAFHDAHLNRVTGVAGRVRTRTLADLANLPVLGGDPVPALESLLAAFPDACFTLDIKQQSVIAPLARVLQTADVASRVCVAAARGSWLRATQERDRPDLLRDVLIARGQWHTPDSYGASPTVSDRVS